eukprot:gene5680-11201_t
MARGRAAVLTAPRLWGGCCALAGAAAHNLTFGSYSYRLAASTAAATLWTTPTTHKIDAAHVPPAATQAALFLSAARHEFEP